MQGQKRPIHLEISCVFLVLAIGFSLALYPGCDSRTPSGPDTTSTVKDTIPDDISHVQWSANILSPRNAPVGVSFPVVIKQDIQSIFSTRWYTCNLLLDGTIQHPLTIKRGITSKSVSFQTEGDHSLSLNGFPTEVGMNAVHVFTPDSFLVVNGTLEGANLFWSNRNPVLVESDITIPAGQKLVIDPGTVILLDEIVSIEVEGSIICNGLEANPILFTASQGTDTWGGLYLSGEASTFHWTFFTRGGGDPDREFGHSHSQPVIYIEYSSAQFQNCFIIDNPGKAFGSSHAEVILESCLVSRCDTGGEHMYSRVEIANSWFVDIPNDDSEEIDDDNDAIYLLNPPDSGDHYSVIRNTVFATGKDDAIDHNGSFVRVESCVIEDFDNEGIAASNQNRIEITNSLFLNNEQGIEAGYGEPEVVVDHCLLIGNETGLRFGDWYEWRDPEGSLTVTNTISVNNSLHNVWNWVASTGLPRSGAIIITYSLVNEAEYDTSEGNIVGSPEFIYNYQLAPGSPGTGAAEDSTNIGLQF